MNVDDVWISGLADAGRALWGVDLSEPQFHPLLEPPSDPKHGDASSGVCFKLARALRKPPPQLAQALASRLASLNLPYVRAVETAGGYVNLRATPELHLDTVRRAVTERDAFGRSSIGAGRRVLIEHTSANPTGPLHIAHGRQAAIGDSHANVLDFAGYRVEREFYVNDTGNQIDLLGRSILARYRQSFDPAAPFPESGYHGEYVSEIARSIREREGDRWLRAPEPEAVAALALQGRDRLFAEQKKDLADFRVRFDSWYSEEELRRSGRVESSIEDFRRRGWTEEKDGALFLRAKDLGDIQDWVLIKSDSSYTYRTPDFAYHRHKFERGFETVIDLLGPDHKSHADTMTLVMAKLGHPDLRALLVQHCTLLRGGVEVKMSKRAGTYVTLRELIDEVGTDAARFFFLMRKTSTPLDFDIEVAKKQTLENPVYYVQNAHARVCSVWKKGVEKGRIPASEVRGSSWEGSLDGAVLSPAEIEVLQEAAKFRRAVEGAARDLDPSRLCTYLHELAGRFHRYYQNRDHVILCDDVPTRLGRMGMAAAVQVVLRNGLALLGVTAPEWMERLEEPAPTTEKD